jgi:protein-L-isoaspartate(D-aspartate) O-methyltransferase
MFGHSRRRLREAREGFAAEIAARCGLRSEALVQALATVPRERFLPPGPWLVLEGSAGYESTPDADLERVYRDVAIAIDPARLLNNSQPSLMAGVLDALEIAPGESVVHVGASSGYYTALLAHLVGDRGRVTAYEISPEIASWARRNLRGLRQVELRRADALEAALPPADVVWVDAGVTSLRTEWLDALRPGGRLAAPLTALRAPIRATRFVRNHIGRVLLVRRTKDAFAARFGAGVAIMALHGGRTPDEQQALDAAYRAGGFEEVRSLRRDPHGADASCWVHVGPLCLSRRAPGGEGEAP